MAEAQNTTRLPWIVGITVFLTFQTNGRHANDNLDIVNQNPAFREVEEVLDEWSATQN